jgi:GDPmannose 4,6-dehydratase
LKRAVIVGSGGQDGRLLFDLLTAGGYSIVGIERSAVRLKDADAVSPEPIDIFDERGVGALLERFQPDEVYYLAAYHHPAEQPTSLSAAVWTRSFDTHVHGLISFLNGIRRHSPASRLFYACSCLVFGDAPGQQPQNEGTPVDPRSPYAISKAAGWHTCRWYRERWSVSASVGILYNHESYLRADRYVSKKIVKGAVRIAQGQQRELILGDLCARVDWGAAEDFVRAMAAILALPRAADFVIATGQPHTVAELARLAFDAVHLNWKNFVREQPGIVQDRRAALVGDASKLRTATGWRPSITFEQLVENMVARELARQSLAV